MTCPVCGRVGCRVQEQHAQATRSESKRSLGWYGYCPDCDVSFRAPEQSRREALCLTPEIRPGHTAASTHVGSVAGCPDCDQ